MGSIFRSLLWQISVPPPWKALPCEDWVEFTQPEGTGALHISGARKKKGEVRDDELRAQLHKDAPEDLEMEPVRFADFVGYGADYVDWNASVFWRKWFVRSGRVMLFITYNCKRGEEEFEMTQVCEILSSLKCRST
jgi:hypothetical protein